MTNPKPPPIVVGVQGIAPRKSMQDAALARLQRLCGLPPFQMFMMQREPVPALAKAHEFAMQRAAACTDIAALFAEYEAWHAAQGKWPNETPDGEPKQ